MGLDGFSIGNLGLNTDMTSAQLANQAEHIALKEAEIKIKDVTELADGTGIKRKEENSENANQFSDGFKKKNEDEQDEEDETPSNIDEKDLESNDPKDFSVRINPETEMVELYSSKEERILETISAKDLMGLISKLNSASGILVNRKI